MQDNGVQDTKRGRKRSAVVLLSIFSPLIGGSFAIVAASLLVYGITSDIGASYSALGAIVVLVIASVLAVPALIVAWFLYPAQWVRHWSILTGAIPAGLLLYFISSPVLQSDLIKLYPEQEMGIGLLLAALPVLAAVWFLVPTRQVRVVLVVAGIVTVLVSAALWFYVL